MIRIFQIAVPAILVKINNCFITCKKNKIICAILLETFDFAPSPPRAYISVTSSFQMSTNTLKSIYLFIRMSRNTEITNYKRRINKYLR